MFLLKSLLCALLLNISIHAPAAHRSTLAEPNPAEPSNLFGPPIVAGPPVYETPLLYSPDVLIDVGHGGLDGGATHGSLLEKNINLQMGMRLYQYMSALGLHVVLDRMGDYALSEDNHWLKIRSRHKRDLAQRKEIANQLHPRSSSACM